MPDVWIVLVEDRHDNVEALPFSAEEAAVAAAREEAVANARSHDDVEWDAQLNRAMVDDGWVLWLPYGIEGDRVRVVRRTLDALPRLAFQGR